MIIWNIPTGRQSDLNIICAMVCSKTTVNMSLFSASKKATETPLSKALRLCLLKSSNAVDKDGCDPAKFPFFLLDNSQQTDEHF